MELKAAVENAKRAARGERPVIEDDSIYSGLRRRRPDLKSYTLPKSHPDLGQPRDRGRVLGGIAPSDAVRQLSARALLPPGPRRAGATWPLPPNARSCLPTSPSWPSRDDGPVEVPIDSSEPIGREWSLVYDAPAFGAVLSAWERPGQEATADADRRFEALWSVEPELVRDASTVAYGIVERVAPDVRRRHRGAPGPPRRAPAAEPEPADGADQPDGRVRERLSRGTPSTALIRSGVTPSASASAVPRAVVIDSSISFASSHVAGTAGPITRSPPDSTARTTGSGTCTSGRRAARAGAARPARCRRRTATGALPARTRGARRTPGGPAPRSRSRPRPRPRSAGRRRGRRPETGIAGSSDRRSSRDSQGSPGVYTIDGANTVV